MSSELGMDSYPCSSFLFPLPVSFFTLLFSYPFSFFFPADPSPGSRPPPPAPDPRFGTVVSELGHTYPMVKQFIHDVICFILLPTSGQEVTQESEEMKRVV
jgi:hypothetical protein